MGKWMIAIGGAKTCSFPVSKSIHSVNCQQSVHKAIKSEEEQPRRDPAGGLERDNLFEGVMRKISEAAVIQKTAIRRYYPIRLSSMVKWHQDEWNKGGEGEEGRRCAPWPEGDRV